MSALANVARSHTWLDGLGDWSWPGTAATAEVLPPSWVPALPPRREGAAGPLQPARRRTRWPRIALATVGAAAAALAGTVAIEGAQPLERALGYRSASAPPVAAFAAPRVVEPRLPLPRLALVNRDHAGSAIEHTSYISPALGGSGSFYVYLPPGYSPASGERYPVIYLLHGNSQAASAFLQIGVQGELDQLIAVHEVQPMIAVMIQGGPGANNWRNQGRRRYEDYVLEVQQIVDRILPTVPTRNARAIAGLSMGGYGAMHIALGNIGRFAVAESWLGFFNGLGGSLAAATPTIARDGLHAFVYGGESDKIANPAEDEPFAASLRAAGAQAQGVVYAGGHSLETVQAHLGSMLVYAGHALAERDTVAAGSHTG